MLRNEPILVLLLSSKFGLCLRGGGLDLKSPVPLHSPGPGTCHTTLSQTKNVNTRDPTVFDVELVEPKDHFAWKRSSRVQP